jgi:plastocyanin
MGLRSQLREILPGPREAARLRGARAIRRALASAVLTLALAQTGLCGDIYGKVDNWSSPASGIKARPAVVWLVGISKFSQPTGKPTMAQSKGRFVPSFLVVVGGQSVAMPNQDQVAHNIYSTSATNPFNLGFYANGDYREVSFDKPGLVEVGCVIHQGMRATILVVPNPYFASVDENGGFRLKHVPKGTYTLRFWSEALLPESRPVTVGDAESVEVRFEGIPAGASESGKPAGAN